MTRALAAALVAVLAACGGPPERAPRDVVLVVIDTLRRDHVGAYGGAVATPHMDALAARGQTLDALASFHQTTMSMGALFTGRTPSIESSDAARPLAWTPAAWCGMGRFAAAPGGDVCLPPSLPTLGEALRARGYHTVAVVSNALLFRPAGFERGFAVWTEVGERRGKLRDPRRAAALRAGTLVNASLRESLAGRPDDAPLFLYVHYLDAHDWIHVGVPYAEAVARADTALGELLAILAEEGLDDAAIVLTSDHGERLGEQHFEQGFPHHTGNPSFATVLEVPLIVAGAEELPAASLVRGEDVQRLLLGLAGAPPPPPTTLAPDELLVGELLYRTYQRGRFKSYWSREGRFALVDLAADPGETRDVAATHPEISEAHRSRVETLSRALHAEGLPSDAPLSDDARARLQALGYLGADAP